MSRRIPERLTWAIEQLAPASSDSVLEIGCGTGVAAALLCVRLVKGQLTAIDRSATMIAAARRRNRACTAARRAIFHRSALAEVDFAPASFNRALAVNVNVFWLGPVAELAILQRVLRPGGMLCLVYEPPSPFQLAQVGNRCAEFLRSHGFTRVRVKSAHLNARSLVSIRAFTRIP